jgi:hypothetical protein
MADVPRNVNSPAPIPAAHAHHDRVLVSRYAAGDGYEGEGDLARQLVERCAECASLASDIRALSTALAASHAPRRPRDFRLDAQQAERLRGNTLQRLLRRIAAPGLAPVRPLAGVALSIGLAMAVVGAALPTTQPATLMSIDNVAPPAESPAQGPVDPQHGALPEPLPGEVAPPGQKPAMEGEGLPRGDAAGAPSEDTPNLQEQYTQRQLAAADDADGTRNVLVFGGLGIALIALGVLVAVIVARRRLHDPLLR